MKSYKQFFFPVLLLTLLFSSCTQQPHFTFAWLSDIHLGSYASAEDDLRQAIEDINTNPEVDFAILSGDLTEFGDTKEFELLHQVLQTFEKPYLMLPGNHDVNWSENGCTRFNKYFESEHFCYDWQGVRFIGCGAGPSLRMGPPHIPREEIIWLDSIIQATPEEQPIIFVNHFPLNGDLSNWYEVIDIIKQRNVQAALAGHLHVNRPYDAEGIPAVIGRSNLRNDAPIGGYNLVILRNDSLIFQERTIKTETHPAWHAIALAPIKEKSDTTYYRPEYSLNEQYPAIKQLWKIKDITDVASQGNVDEAMYIYTNTQGVVHALDAHTGQPLWQFVTGNKMFSTPHILPESVVVSSCDGYVYLLNKADGKMIWKYDTGYPIVACPLVDDGVIYLGSGNGCFHALRVADGSLLWKAEGLKGYIESRPAVDAERVYIGTWGAMFYAFDRKTGEKVWEFDTGLGRYFSPGACWPEVLSYRKNGKVKEQVIVLSSDYYVRSFNPADGKILWASNEAKGRESLGFSPDGKTIYIKGIQRNITAVDVSTGSYKKLWDTTMPYAGNFIPTRMEASDDLIFVPTEFGVIHAVRTDGSGLAWSYKVSHSAVTSLKLVHPNQLIVMTMDGTVACLKW